MDHIFQATFTLATEGGHCVSFSGFASVPSNFDQLYDILIHVLALVLLTTFAFQMALLLYAIFISLHFNRLKGFFVYMRL